MRITEQVEAGKRYYWKRSDGWKGFDGKEHWWEYFIEPTGLNGGGGWWVLEWHRWNSSGWEWSPQPRSLTWEETRDILQQIENHGYLVDRGLKTA